MADSIWDQIIDESGPDAELKGEGGDSAAPIVPTESNKTQSIFKKKRAIVSELAKTTRAKNVEKARQVRFKKLATRHKLEAKEKLRVLQDQYPSDEDSYTDESYTDEEEEEPKRYDVPSRKSSKEKKCDLPKLTAKEKKQQEHMNKVEDMLKQIQAASKTAKSAARSSKGTLRCKGKSKPRSQSKSMGGYCEQHSRVPTSIQKLAGGSVGMLRIVKPLPWKATPTINEKIIRLFQ